MTGRVVVFRDLANELEPHADSIQDLSNSFTAQINDIDVGIQAIFKQAEIEIGQGVTQPDVVGQVHEFVSMLRNLSASADEGLGSLQAMIDSISAVKISRATCVRCFGSSVVASRFCLTGVASSVAGLPSPTTLRLQSRRRVSKTEVHEAGWQ